MVVDEAVQDGYGQTWVEIATEDTRSGHVPVNKSRMAGQPKNVHTEFDGETSKGRGAGARRALGRRLLCALSLSRVWDERRR